MDDVFHLHCEKYNSAEKLQYERCRSDVRKILLLGEVIKKCQLITDGNGISFLKWHSCIHVPEKGVPVAWPRGKWLLSLFPKVPSISVNPEHMKRPGKFT